MARVKVRLITDGIEAMKQHPAVVKQGKTQAEAIAARARSSGPVATGQYVASIHAETDPQNGQSRVVADAPHALVVESRTGNLARAVP